MNGNQIPRFFDLSGREPDTGREQQIGFQPKFSLAIRMTDMDMQSWLLARKEKKRKPPSRKIVGAMNGF
jgi:hypothetical protein